MVNVMITKDAMTIRLRPETSSPERRPALIVLYFHNVVRVSIKSPASERRFDICGIFFIRWFKNAIFVRPKLLLHRRPHVEIFSFTVSPDQTSESRGRFLFRRSSAGFRSFIRGQ